MTDSNEVTSLANDLRDRMSDLGLFLQEDTVRKLAIWLSNRMPAAAPAPIMSDADDPLPPETEALFKRYGLDVQHGSKSHVWLSTSVLFDALAPCVERAGPAVRMAYSTLKQRFQILGMEKVKRFEIDEDLRKELRQLARALEAQIAFARQREIELRNAIEPALAQMAAAIVKLTGEAPQAPTKG